MTAPNLGSVPDLAPVRPPPALASFPPPAAKKRSPWKRGFGAILLAVALLLGFFVMKLTLALVSLFVIYDVGAGEPVEPDGHTS